MILSDLSPADLGELSSKLYEIEFNGQNFSHWQQEDYLRELESPKCRLFFWVDKNNEAYQGFVLYREQAKDTLEIMNLAVNSKGRGLGRQLLKIWLQNVAAHYCRQLQIFLEVRASNRAAQRIYEDAGFVRVGLRKNYYRNGEDAFIFQRS